MKHFVYVMRGRVSGRHYIGTTSDVARRLNDHNRGKSRSVRGRGPFEIVWIEAHPNRQEAMARECQLKRYKGGEAFRRLIGLSPSSSG